mmetsp:Transcript_9443/g.23166  ORF Transcript_9443/g.23166 Transcript_9443/m.23166 type:complete len:86 (-) Transcript_9443:107-364(-)
MQTEGARARLLKESSAIRPKRLKSQKNSLLLNKRNRVVSATAAKEKVEKVPISLGILSTSSTSMEDEAEQTITKPKESSFSQSRL